MTTPIERGAEALAVYHGNTDGEDRPQGRLYTSQARAVFESIAEVPLRRVLDQHRYCYEGAGNGIGEHPCSCGLWAGYWSSFNGHIATAIKAHLLGGE